MLFYRALRPVEKQAEALTYAAAGVSVDNGNALVEAIKPVVKATRRPGADGEIGGFGGAFDMKAAGFRDPILVSGTDGVGTKLRVALDCGIHTSVGQFEPFDYPRVPFEQRADCVLDRRY